MLSRQWSCCYPESSVGTPGFVTEFDLWDDEQDAAADRIDAELARVDLVRVAFCDPHGLARSKTVPSDVFRTVLRNGMDFSPGPFLFDTGHAIAVDFLNEDADVGVGEISGAGDFVLVPDPRTFQVLPHLEPRTAWVLGDEYLRDGSPHPLSARRILRMACERFQDHSLAPVVGLEVEWYLTRLLDGPPGNEGNGFGLQGSAPTVEAVNAGYQFNLDSLYDCVAQVTDPLAMMLRSLGLPLRSMEHESGPGQMETTFSPMHALDAADAMLVFRTLVKQTCARRGFHASFMSLPGLQGFDPSGWHLHQSVMSMETGANLFASGVGEGVSSEGKAYLDGLLNRAREYCILSVPTVNGYRRLASRFTLSPTVVDWSFESRTVMARVLGAGSSTHIENRVGEPCANPYLAMAAQLSAGLDGMVGDPREASDDGSRQALPQSLREALKAFRESPHAQQLLGRPLTACLVKLKHSEASRFEAWCADEKPADNEVTEWEQREYFRTF